MIKIMTCLQTQKPLFQNVACTLQSLSNQLATRGSRLCCTVVGERWIVLLVTLAAIFQHTVTICAKTVQFSRLTVWPRLYTALMSLQNYFLICSKTDRAGQTQFQHDMMTGTKVSVRICVILPDQKIVQFKFTYLLSTVY